MKRRTLLGRTIGWSALGPLGAAASGCAPPGATGPKDAAAPVTVHWPSDSDPLSQQFAQEFTKRFNAKHGPRITAVAEPKPSDDNRDTYEKWTAMAVAGQLPEIVQLCCVFIRPFMIKGLALDLSPLVRDLKPADVTDFYKSPLESMSIGGRQLALPGGVNMNMAFVNKGHLREMGLPYPDENWTKAQLLDYVVKLNRPGGERWGYDMPFAGLDRNVTFIWTHGGEPHDPKDGPEVTKLAYDDPKTVEGLQFLHDLIWKHQVSPTGNEQRGGQNNTNAFINGKTAVYFDATSKAGEISTKAPQTGLDWDFLPLVKGPGNLGHGSRHSLDGWLIDRQTKVADAAWSFLREFVSVEGQTLRAQIERREPSRRSAAGAWEQVYPGKNTRLSRLMAETARPDPRSFWKDSDQVQPILTRYLQASLLRNELGVAEAMRRAMAEVRGCYAGK